MPLKNVFLARTRCQLSVAALCLYPAGQHSLYISLPASKGHTGCVRHGCTCARLSYQNYTVATEVHNLLLQTLSIKPHSLLLSLSLCDCIAVAGRCLLAFSFLVRSLPAGSATWLPPTCPGSALCAALAFSGSMINA